MIEEIWKDIDFTNGEYQVSNLGRVKSIARTIMLNNGIKRFVRERILQNIIDSKNYFMVGIYGKQYRVHRLVAIAFIDNVDSKEYINHIDSNRQNNIIENLEWVSHQENMKHAWDKDRFPKKYGIHNPKSKAVNQFDMDGNFIKKWDSMSDVQRELNIRVNHLSVHIRNNQRYKSVKGFKFQYA